MSRGYQRKIKSDIKKKLKTFTELEIPLLIQKGIITNSFLSIFSQNLRTNPQINNQNFSVSPSNIQIQYQNMVGRKGFEPSNPAMSRQLDSEFWHRFKEHLSSITSNETRNDRISYAKKYYSILYDGNASELLALSNDKRIHAMKSISAISKYLGCYDLWKQIIMKYQLKWSTENSMDSFNDIWNTEANYSSMLSWIKETYQKLPKEIGNILIYCTLTGLRSEEGIISLRLIHNELSRYLNKETMTLEHFRYPKLFIRRTKKAYVSIITDSVLEIARKSGGQSYNAIRLATRRNDIDMRMSYCRKVFATYLRTNGIESEIIDLLQGRIPKSVFVRHYYRPDPTNDRIRNILEGLLNAITN